MFARATTVKAQLEAIDTGITHIRDQVMPAVMEVDGCIGLSLIVDRESGRCIATSAWESEAAMRASAMRLESIRNMAAEQFKGSIEKVEEWEIAVLHREHRAGDSACVRCTWLQAPADALDAAIDAYKTRVLPEAEDMDGFCSASLFVNRATGIGVGATAWESRDAMQRSSEQANRLRSSTIQQFGGQLIEVAEFDLALAHLRVPELA